MIYDYFVKIFGSSGVASAIIFLFLKPVYFDNNLAISAELSSPITKETSELIKKGFVFNVEYYTSIIISGKKTYRKSFTKTIHFKNSQWFVDNLATYENELQKKTGAVYFEFNELEIKENEKVVVFIKASIVKDKDFYKSTGLNTTILWNYYVPRINKTFICKSGRLIETEN